MATDYEALAEQARGETLADGIKDFAAIAARVRGASGPPRLDADSLAATKQLREMNSPGATQSRWLRTLPYIFGAGAALLTRNPRGAGLGAEVGAGLAQILQESGGGMAGQYAANKLTGAPAGQLVWGDSGSISPSVVNGYSTLITPEPATLSLLVLGGIGLVFRRRRAAK